jgi:signal transduction histidine kinase
VSESTAASTPVQILVVEDNARHAELIRDELELEVAGSEVMVAEGVEAARRAVENRSFDLVILDFRLQDGDGLEILREFREAGREEPIVFVTTTAAASVAVQAMKLGAADYVVKEEGYVSILPFVARDVLERVRLRRERVELERRLERAEHLAALHKLTAGIAHNLNNPLTTVRTFLELLPARYATDEEFRTSYYELVLQEVRRIRDLVGSMMRAVTIAEVEENDPWRVGDLVHEVESYLRPSLGEKEIRLECDAGDDVPALTRGREAIKQAMIILLDNAVAFSPQGGTVWLSSRIRRESSGDQIVVEVADEGPGVPREHEKSIFDPFFSTRAGGVGIGLFVANSLARAQGGSIEVGTRDPSGAVFTLTLPPIAD